MKTENKYLYETHLHTRPVSRCAKATVRESLEFYKSLGYAGVFITNHFIDGNMKFEGCDTYEEKINLFFSDYEEGVKIGEEIGLSVFFGAETTHAGTDFLIYGLDKEWFLSHPEIQQMRKKDELKLMIESGALVVQAHPFREAKYIECIRLYPREVHGVEIYNANRTDFENEMAQKYADSYGLLHFAGSDNHIGGAQQRLGGMATDTPITDECDFVKKVLGGKATLFKKSLE